MPTYDYKCAKCGYVFEEFHKINEKPHVKCPKCHSKAEKQISLNSGLIFKGSGFYLTDYKQKKSDSDSPKESKSKPKGKDSSTSTKKE
ncbi:MAG: zinc ribbon domain-containing protein [Ignavibacteria bacterium]|nr:zinc ribbon domain-containing protein [Ignavibacteria bacterium]